MSRRFSHRIGAALLAGVLLSAVAAPSASAHGFNGQPIPDAAQYLSAITAITPVTPGVSAAIDPRGEWISVTNTSATPLIVLGYGSDQYLRIDNSGVSQNAYSPSVALNQALFGQVTPTVSTLPPYWQHIYNGPTASWHDHRIHWMGANRAPNVAAHPNVAQLVGIWNIHLTQNGKPITVTGNLSWLAKKPKSGLSNTAKLFLASDSVIFLIAIAGVGLWIRSKRRTVPDATMSRDQTNHRSDRPVPTTTV